MAVTVMEVSPVVSGYQNVNVYETEIILNAAGAMSDTILIPGDIPNPSEPGYYIAGFNRSGPDWDIPTGESRHPPGGFNRVEFPGFPRAIYNAGSR
jgi:hypothetical protein